MSNWIVVTTYVTLALYALLWVRAFTKCSLFTGSDVRAFTRVIRSKYKYLYSALVITEGLSVMLMVYMLSFWEKFSTIEAFGAMVVYLLIQACLWVVIHRNKKRMESY